MRRCPPSLPAALGLLLMSCTGRVTEARELNGGSVRDSFDAGDVDPTGSTTSNMGPTGSSTSNPGKPSRTADAGDAGSVKGSPDVVDLKPDGMAADCPAGAPLPVDRVRIYTKMGGGAKLNGAQIQGSNEGSTGGFKDLVTIDGSLPDDEFTELRFSNDTLYRFVRFFDPQGRSAPLAEIEFYSGATRLSGRTFGTVSTETDPHPYDMALDGQTDTWYQGATAGGNYVGLDIAGTFVAEAPVFSPPAGNLTKPTEITINSSTANATIYYTLDGTAPTPGNGKVFTAGLQVNATSNLQARAFAACSFPSDVASAVYTVGTQPAAVGQKSYHIGNSLTDTLVGFLKPIADSTGVEHGFARMTVAGAPLGYIWKFRNMAPPEKGEAIKDSAAQDPKGAGDIDNFVRTYAPIDHITVQPFADPELEAQGGAAVGIFGEALPYNPNAQFWIYGQWANQYALSDGNGYSNDALAMYQPNGMQGPSPQSWEEATQAQARYYETFRDYVDARVEGKKVLVIPAGLALIELKHRVESGKMPGVTQFFPSVFADYLHLSDTGRYLVSLVFYSCFYRQTPEGRVTYRPDGVTAEQAQVLQQIAWQVTSSYPLSGL